MSRTDEVIDSHLPGLGEEARATVERLIDVVLDVLPDAQAERKWGRLTFTREDDWHHWICAVSATKKAVKLAIHKGALLDDPSNVMEGEGQYTRSIPFGAPEDVDAGVLTPILREAKSRQREM